MKYKLIAFGLMAGLLAATSTSALSIQKNVHAGYYPIDGGTVITRYSSNVLPSTFRLGVEQQGYNEVDKNASSYTTLPMYRYLNEADTTIHDVDTVTDSDHRMSKFTSRAARIRNSWANLFE